MSVAERAEELRQQLTHHGHRYYVLDDPEIGDDAYDALLDELRAIERDHPELLTPDSPTQRVGGEPVSKLEKVTHLQPMLSLANARSEEELRAWIGRMRNTHARSSSSERTLPSDSIGSGCLTFSRRETGSPPTRRVGESGVSSTGWRASSSRSSSSSAS